MQDPQAGGIWEEEKEAVRARLDTPRLEGHWVREGKGKYRTLNLEGHWIRGGKGREGKCRPPGWIRMRGSGRMQGKSSAYRDKGRDGLDPSRLEEHGRRGRMKGRSRVSRDKGSAGPPGWRDTGEGDRCREARLDTSQAGGTLEKGRGREVQAPGLDKDEGKEGCREEAT